MIEIWMKTKICEFHEVSNLGNVRSIDRYVKHNYGGSKIVKGQIRKLSVGNNGYLGLSINRKRYSVHRLVAECFIKNFNNLPCVNHIDGIKTNNIVNNLEWVTYSENQKHAYKNGLKDIKGENHSQVKLTESDVKAIRDLYNQKVSHKEIAEIYKISKSHVGSIGRKKVWSHV
jgi:hypothetical protein